MSITTIDTDDDADLTLPDHINPARWPFDHQRCRERTAISSLRECDSVKLKATITRRRGSFTVTQYEL